MKENLVILMDFLLICTYNDYENITLLTDCNYMQFFEVFKDIGLKDFLIACTNLVFDKHYHFDNYMFITNLIVLYFYYIDPHDSFSFTHYFTEFCKFEVVQKVDNFISNLNQTTFDDLYTKNVVMALRKDSNDKGYVPFNERLFSTDSEQNLLALNEIFIKLEYPFITDPNDYWVTQIARNSRFFLFLEYIVESKDFAFEENIRLFELMEYKLANPPVEISKIFVPTRLIKPRS